MGDKMKQHYANEDGWSEPDTPVMRGYKLCCCDCGLVHNVDFNVLEVTGYNKDGTWNAEYLPIENYRVELRMQRNNRSTGQIKRHMINRKDR